MDSRARWRKGSMGRSLVGRYLLRVYLPLLLLIWLGVSLALWLERDTVERHMGRVAAAQLQSIDNHWQDKLNGTIEDMRIVKDHEILLTWLRLNDRSSLDHLRMAWNYFMLSKRIYDQLGFVDRQGLQRVWIDHTGGVTRTVPDAELGSIADSELYRQGMRLADGEVFISALAPDRAQGQIVMPIKPVIRLVAPVFIDGARQGLVVLKVLAADLLERRKTEEGREVGRLMILNHAGYFLRGASPDETSGFMFPGMPRESRLQDRLPALWRQIRQSPHGVIANGMDITVFRQIRYPVMEIAGLRVLPVRDWFLLMQISSQEIALSTAMGRQITIAAGLGVSLLSLLFALFYARVARAKLEHLKSASELGARLEAVMDTVPDAILTFDATGRVETFNAATRRIFECSEAWLGRTLLFDMMPEGREELNGLIQGTFSRQDGSLLNIRREFSARRESGEWFPLELTLTETERDEGRLFIAIARDITERKAVEEQIQRKALYDDLTNLPNRLLLRTKMDSMISLAQRRQTHGAVLFMDLDNFKTINDSIGHMAGDTLLRRVAERLISTLRSEDVVSRLGGDEFVVVLPMLGDDRQASTAARDVAEKLRQALNQPVMLEGLEYVVTPSIGIVLFPSEGLNADDLLRHADTAMYRAKAAGRNTIRFFHPSMQAEVNDRLRVGKELRLAVEQGQLELYLQPQIDAQYECVVGAEALIRWNHPIRGLLGPGAFIPHAEDLGMIAEVGEWVMREGFSILQRLLRDLPCKGMETLAINLSPRHFRNPSFLSRLRGLMQEFKIPAHRIELEITENLLLEDMEEAVEKMTAIKEMGIGFAIDDFGTGFSSLAYLKRLPVGRLKIDRSFISGVDRDPYNAPIVETILAMARVLQLEVTAEGVEQIGEKTWLMDRGCTQIQGFLYSRPLKVDDFIHFCQVFGKRHTLSTEREQA